MEDIKQKTTYESSLKSQDTEEYLDLVFYRPLGYRWALLFAKLGIVPNAVTIASIFIGVAAAVMFYFDNITYNVIGILLLIWANSFDSADGQLARMTGNFSRMGRILDGMSGDIWFIAIYLSVCLRLMNSEWGISIFFIAAIAGYFHARQASIADYYRNFHLFFLKGIAGSELEDSEQLKQKYRELTWRKDAIYKLFMVFYINYTQGQESLTPYMQNLRFMIRKRYGDNLPAWIKIQFREMSMPLMKYTNILSFNTRVIVLFITIVTNTIWIYFLFELTILNLILIYMLIRHERICQYFIDKISIEN